MNIFILESLLSPDTASSIMAIIDKTGIAGLLVAAVWYLEKKHREDQTKYSNDKIEYDKEVDVLRIHYDDRIDSIMEKYESKIETITGQLIVVNSKQAELLERTASTLSQLTTSIDKLADKIHK